MSDIQVRVAGDTAVATSFAHEKGAVGGEAYEFKGRSLMVLSRQAGHWMILALHD